MPIFRKLEFEEMEGKYSSGVNFAEDNHVFRITLKSKVPYPTRILDYDWKVELEDGFEFNVPMAPDLLTPPFTRIEWIVEILKEKEKYENNYLANAINDKIDEVYRKYK